jgi:hypothetical protein
MLAFSLCSGFSPAVNSVFSAATPTENSYQVAGNYGWDGYRGSRGRDGRNGRDGRDGQNQSIYADGSPISFDLSGSNGEDGEDGQNAFRPHCDHDHEHDHHDINVADGENGGRGGNGGNGGNGGSLTVYYDNLANLSKILVHAVGGTHGRAGRGGRGSAGCDCDRRSWEINNKTYRCNSGRDGSYGSYGREGNQGRLGILSIVKGKTPLLNDASTQKLTISQLVDQQFTLAKNKWKIHHGAASLLAIGSLIEDEYREFEQRLEVNFQLIWAEKRAIADFSNQSATIKLNDNQEVEVIFPENLWIDGTSKRLGKLVKFTVHNLIPQKEATRLAVGDFRGSGQNLTLKIVDLAAKSDVINTQFYLRYRAQNKFSDSPDYRTFYDQEIPASLVTRDYNQFTLALGKLNIPQEYISSGINVDIQVLATRSLGTRSAKQKLNWEGITRN